MAPTMPIVQGNMLSYQHEGHEQTLVVGSAAWYTWLRTATTFAFRSDRDTFHLRKERAGNQRGRWYWHAYRKRDGKIEHVSVGKSEELTLQRLNALAATLAQRDEISVQEPQPLQQAQPEVLSEPGRVPQPARGASWSQTERAAASQSATRGASTLPVPLTSLIGRKQEVAAACTLLRRSEVRLLTLTGTGGVGKTRLALQVATELLADFPDGVSFVSLAPISDPAFVVSSIAQVLGINEIGMRPLADLLKASLQEKQLLLVLDNVEQVVTAAPSLVDLLSACPRLKLLVTSREVLRVRGEHELVVQPLALPDPKHLPDNETLAHYGAVALFLERAQEVQPTFELTAVTAQLITEICRRLDGLPLTIELAAARLKLLSLPALLERLSHRLAVLTGGPRDLPARQQTLRATLAWSYELLSQEEQRLFRLLSVFVGGCTLEAVEQMARRLGGQSIEVLDGVSSLLDKHLLSRTEQDTKDPRLLMLETIREFGLQALQARGELAAAQEAHAQYYLALAEEADAHLLGEEHTRWFEKLEREYDNLRAALSWALERGAVGQSMETALRVAGELGRFWGIRGHLSEGRHWLEQVLTRSTGIISLGRAKALLGAGWLAYLQEDDEQAEAFYQESLQLYREAGDTQGTVRLLQLLGLLTVRMGNHRAARSLLEESLVLARQLGEKSLLAYGLLYLADLTMEQNEYSAAQSLLEESLALFRQMRHKAGMAWSLRELGRVLFAQGDDARASWAVEESLALYREIKHMTYLAYTLDLLGQLALCLGDAPKARSLLEEGLALFRRLGVERHVAYVLSHVASVALVQEDDRRARALYEESLAIFKEVDDPRGMASCLQGWATMAARQGEAAWAARLWGAAQALLEASHPRDPLPFLLPGQRTSQTQWVSTVRAHLGEQAWAQGRTMTPEQAIAAQGQPLLSPQPLANANTKLRTKAQKRASPTYPNGLTQREVEVLRLLPRGLTDAQIAEALGISPRTVNAHLRSIYAKLGVTSRHAAMHYALQQKLVSSTEAEKHP